MNSLRNSTISLSLVLAMLSACGDESPQASLASAKSYLAKGDLRAATIQVKNALQAKPDFPEARYLLGVVFLDDGKSGPAEQELRKALAANYPADAAVPKLAEALLANHDYKKLTQELASASLTSPSAKARLQTVLSKAYAALGELPAADAALAAALAADPVFGPARLLEARKKASSQDYDGALAILNELLLAAPLDAEILTVKADVLEHGKHETAAAVESYRKAIRAKPGYLAAHMAYIETMFVEKDWAAAAVAVSAMKKAAPDATQTLYEEARLAYFRKDNKLALERAQALLKRNPDNAAALQVAGAIELQANELTRAQAHLSYALQQWPQSLLARQSLVVTYLRLGHPEKALATLQLARQPGRDFPPSLLSLAGEVYLRNGDPERAEAYFQKAAKLDAEDPGKRTVLALTRMIRGQVEPAFAELESIASMDKGYSADMALISARLQRGQYDKALADIASLEKKRPNDPIGALLLGRTQLQMKDASAARKSFQRALQIKPDYFPAIESLASMDMAEKKVEAARKRFEDVVARDPANGQALLALARITAVTGGDHKEVGEFIRRAIAVNRFDVDSRRALIDLYLRDKDLKQASAAAVEAVAAIPDSPELLDALGGVQRASGELNQALASYAKLSAMQPESPGPLLRTADVQMALADAAAAEQSLRKALELAPDLLEAQLRLVSLQVHQKRYADALAVAKTVQRQRAKEPAGYLLEGDIALARGDKSAALSVFRQSLARAPSTSLAVKVHSLLMASSSPADAGSFANVWLKEHPSDSDFLVHLGDVALTQKDYAGAMDRYLAVVRLKPRDAGAFNNLAWLADQTGKSSALEYARKANELEPRQPAYMDTLATVLASVRNYPEAIKVQRSVMAAQPANPQWRLNLAKIYKDSGDRKQAREELEVLAKLGSKFPAQAEVAALLGAL